ncbi:MAG: hypothetical protein ACO1PB_04715 [Ramlibacter sp.]
MKNKNEARESMDNANEAPGWGRQELNVRLTKRRLAQLRSIAERLPGRPSPTDAIDAALAHASDAEGAIPGRIDEVEASMELHAAERRAEAARLESAMKATQKAIADLHALISAAVADPDGL